MRRRARRVFVVVDGPDSVDSLRDLLALHDIDRGCLVCHPRPWIQTTSHLGEDILVALGKSFGAIRGVPSRDRLDVAEVWIRAEGVRDLVVLRAHLLRPALWGRLEDLAGRCDMRLWLVVHKPGAHVHSPALGRRRGVPVATALESLRERVASAPEGPDGPRLDGDLVRCLRKVASPGHAAVLALAMAAGAGPNDIVSLSRSGISAKGDSVVILGRTFSVPPNAAMTTRALRIATVGWMGSALVRPNGLSASGPVVAGMLVAAARQAGIPEPEALSHWPWARQGSGRLSLMPDRVTSKRERGFARGYIERIPPEERAKAQDLIN